ncbi:hypothetical protein TNCV_3573271 [Trichonephila clavipes]|nr:hypothetical protein TNCV_3573271 [Trichonephila clavipes]
MRTYIDEYWQSMVIPVQVERLGVADLTVFENGSKHRILMTMSAHTSSVKPRQHLRNLLVNVRTPIVVWIDHPATFMPVKTVLLFYLENEVKAANQDFLANQPCSF